MLGTVRAMSMLSTYQRGIEDHFGLWLSCATKPVNPEPSSG